MDGKIYEVVESSFSRMQQRKATVRAKIRNLSSGKVVDINLQASDYFEEAAVAKRPLVFLYQHRGEYVFVDSADQKKRLNLKEDFIRDKKKWLKPGVEITAVFYEEKLLNFTLPIKMDFKVTEAPPGVQGDRATSGTKAVIIETGTVVQTPPFINEGDIIRVNTETGEYVERSEKN